MALPYTANEQRLGEPGLTDLEHVPITATATDILLGEVGAGIDRTCQPLTGG